jgi:nitrite reductase/ring-hydroxylating ferredoxin subunit
VAPRTLTRVAAAGLAAAAVIALAWWLAAPDPQTHGVLLTVGPAAKADPYAVAQGAVTHGEAVLIDFGDGTFAFYVNRSEEVRALVNGCGDRVAPSRQQRLPVLVDARFEAKNVPPYVVQTPTTHYRFDAAAGGDATCR